MDYDNIQFAASESALSFGFVKYEAYLFHNGENYVGACCFRWPESTWQLDWLWMHPFVRRRGYLKKAWPQFEKKYGHFDLTKPISCEMEIFLRKVRWFET